MQQVKWTKKLLCDLYEHAMLNEYEQYIMESRIKGVPVSVQASHLCCSESTVHRMIAKIKKKYDAVQIKNKHRGVLFWIFVGWWWIPIKWLVFTLPALIIAIFKPKNKKIVTKNYKMCVCQSCGNSWKV